MRWSGSCVTLSAHLLSFFPKECWQFSDWKRSTDEKVSERRKEPTLKPKWAKIVKSGAFLLQLLIFIPFQECVILVRIATPMFSLSDWLEKKIFLWNIWRNVFPFNDFGTLPLQELFIVQEVNFTLVGKMLEENAKITFEMHWKLWKIK